MSSPYTRLSLLAVLLTAAAFPTQAAPLVSYPFTVDTNPSVSAPGIIPSLDLTALLNQYIGDDGLGNVLETYPNPGGVSHDMAIITNSYFSLTLVNASGMLGQLLVSAEVAKGGANNPRGFFVRTDLDSFAADVFNQVLPSTALVPYSFVVDASTVSTLTMRFYQYTPTTGNSVDYRNLQVDPYAPVPEPGTILLAGAGLLGLAALRRRQ